MLVEIVCACVALAACLQLLRRRRRVPSIEQHYPEEAKPGWQGATFRLADAPLISKENKITCYDPATGYLLASVSADTPDTIDSKISRAAEAQRAWKNSSFEERRQCLRTMLAWIQRDLDIIARIACRDTGKTAIDAAFGELLTTCAKLTWTIQHGERVLRPERRAGNLLLAHKRCTVLHEPLGVVAACVSWNYPVHNMLGPIISALFAGNAIIVKCSEHVVWSSQHILTSVHKCMDACGVPRDLVQLVACGPQTVEALTRDARLAHITFIGSDVVGRRVAEAAAPQLTPTTLELGGKDPALILPSTRLDFFTSMCMYTCFPHTHTGTHILTLSVLRACFQAMGQNCIGIERFLIPDSMQDDLVQAVKPRIAALRCGSTLDDTSMGHGAKAQQGKNGDHVDCGAMITDARFDALEELIADAVAHGARLVVGGKRYNHPRWPRGHYFSPTLLTHVTPTMRIAQEEVFGPVFLVMPYRTVDDAVAIANGTPFGLGASVFGRDYKECQHVASQLTCGMVNINEYVCTRLAAIVQRSTRDGCGYRDEGTKKKTWSLLLKTR